MAEIHRVREKMVRKTLYIRKKQNTELKKLTETTPDVNESEHIRRAIERYLNGEES